MNNQFRILFISKANLSPPRAYAELPNITAANFHALLRRLRGMQSAPCPQVSCRRGFLPGNILYKPIDFIGIICYLQYTYKKDMLKE